MKTIQMLRKKSVNCNFLELLVQFPGLVHKQSVSFHSEDALLGIKIIL